MGRSDRTSLGATRVQHVQRKTAAVLEGKLCCLEQNLANVGARTGQWKQDRCNLFGLARSRCALP